MSGDAGSCEAEWRGSLFRLSAVTKANNSVHQCPKKACQESNDYPEAGAGISLAYVFVDPDCQKNVHDEADQEQGAHARFAPVRMRTWLLSYCSFALDFHTSLL